MISGVNFDPNHCPNLGPGVIFDPCSEFEIIRCSNVQDMKQLIHMQSVVNISPSTAIIAMSWMCSIRPLNIPMY